MKYHYKEYRHIELTETPKTLTNSYIKDGN